MTVLIYILIVGSIVLLAAFLLAFMRSRKNSMLSQQYAEALSAENNGETDKAIRLYKETLHNTQNTSIGDKRLAIEIENRLKTLLISTEFEQSFRHKIVIAPVNSPRPKDQATSNTSQIGLTKS